MTRISWLCIANCLLLTAGSLVLIGCQTNLSYEPETRVESTSLAGHPGTRIRDLSDSMLADHQQRDGFVLLSEGLDALVARVALIDAADVSLDLQYYIFANDTAGQIILAKTLSAADRGVRVRLLVDDLGTPVSQPWVTQLAQHPNIEIRIFNPVAARSGISRIFQQMTEFSRANHRMHNKLLVADGMMAVTGGRNIADAYFSNDEILFQDIDIVCVGPVVKQAADSFDTYWNHVASVPVDFILPLEGARSSLSDLRAYSDNLLESVGQSDYGEALKETSLVRRVQSGELSFDWGRAQLYADPPDKATRHKEVDRSQYLVTQLKQVLERSEDRLEISSAYFVPGKQGVAFLTGLEEKGVEVSVLTNALSSTDVAIVHSGYSKYREPLLEGGVELWELRTPEDRQTPQKWLSSDSQPSLHAKAFVIDDDRVVIGSVNLDGRSTIQNTEIAVYIESPALNAELAATFAEWTRPELAWKVVLDEENGLQWRATDDQDNLIVLSDDPGSSGWQRFKIWLLSWLPIEKQI